MFYSSASARATSSSIPTTVTATRPGALPAHAPSSTASSRATCRAREADDGPCRVRRYWQGALDELARCPACPEIEPIPLRSTDFATLYGVRLTSVGPYRVFGYLSIPTGPGPFPAIYYPPKYQSVLEIIPQGTANLQRSRYVTFSLAGRGQRNADSPYAAMFPGPPHRRHRATPSSYVFRGIVADSGPGPGIPDGAAARSTPRAWSCVGNDMALITAALTPGATHVVTDARAVLQDRRAGARRRRRIRWKRSTTTSGCIRHAPRPCAGRSAYYDLRRVRARRHRHDARSWPAPRASLLDGEALKPLATARSQVR